MTEENSHRPYFITICSGKGGVGKSVLAANLAYVLSVMGIKTLVWDADMNLPNQHLIHGVEPPVRVSQAYAGKIDVNTAFFPLKDNLTLLADMPSAGMIKDFDSKVILKAYAELIEEDFDVVIVDTPAGASEDILNSCRIADVIYLVITDEPTSLLDAYGLLKIILHYMGKDRVKLLVNNVIDVEDADEISEKLNLATQKFLELSLDVVGFVPYDRVVRQSIVKQELFAKTEQSSELIKSIETIADKIMQKIQLLELR